MRAIRQRRGQQKFRDNLVKRHGACQVTGCRILDVLEAAHINSYRGEKDNHVSNGLLLRADIHTLFDLDLLGIDPDTLTIWLAESVVNEYRHQVKPTLLCRHGTKPSKAALKKRYDRFKHFNY